MKKRYRLNENGKMMLFSIVMLIVVVATTLIYVDRVKKINNGELKVTCNCERDK